MKLPLNIDKVTISQPEEYWIFPPLGFFEISEANDNTGDSYGLYWELGKENSEPIVCCKKHEDFTLIPEFSNLDSFLLWYEETNGHQAPTLNLRDTTFFMNLYNRSRVLTKTGKTAEAIHALETSVKLFGEYSDSWALLAENYYKINEIEKASFASLNSIISNYVFGLPSKKAIDLFNSIEFDTKFKDNPLVKRKGGILSGGGYANPFSLNYYEIQKVIAEFKEIKDFKSALLLEQNYGYLMLNETNEVRNKNEFNSDNWSKYFLDNMREIYPNRI